MESTDRQIVHLDLDTFFVSVERLMNSKLEGRPVIIGGSSDRGVVASCSYEARKYGVSSGMPVKLARVLCGDSVIIRGDMDLYSRYSKMVTEIIAGQSPLYEKASIDEHYIDMTGMDRFFGSLKWARELRQDIIRNTGLPVSLGFSPNKTVSKIATGEAKPNGERDIPVDRVKPFLAPLSIRKIPMIGEKTYQNLRAMGIATIHTLSQVPPELMERALGRNGLVIWRKANGIDPTPVIPYSERQSISTECTFEQDTTDVEYLRRVLSGMVEKLAFQLRRDEKLTSCVTVRLRYSNFDTHTIQKHIPYTSFDHLLLEVVKDLFRRLYQRRMLIRLIGVKFSGLVHGVQQIGLFEDSPELIRLYQALDHIRRRYGSKAVQRAIGMR